MKICGKLLCAVLLSALVATPALAADYDKTEKTKLYTLTLHVPAAAMAIAPLQTRIMALYAADAAQTRTDAKADSEGNPAFQPYDVSATWRVTFENEAVISLSADIYADTGGAHPNGAFQTLVWDKQAGRPVPLMNLFAAGQAPAAFAAIASAARKAWEKTYLQRSGQKPGPNADMAKDGIGADAEKLKTYALTYAKGETRANGIVLLYGAGEVWPHVLGDFRLSVPSAMFAKFLAPRWKPIFTP
jgi:hypothetical protein